MSMNITITANPFVDGLLKDVDKLADAARLKIVGDGVKLKEYEVAEAQARAYQMDLYMGTAPASVKSWAEAKGWTGQQAAEDILAAADLWMNALLMIRDLRLKAKEGIRTAPSASVATGIYQTFYGTLASLMAGL